MKKYIILIPIYNDRESLTKLIENINSETKDLNSEISVIVINDASSQQIIDQYQNTENINFIEIINMKENRGHARCIASGLKYIVETWSVEPARAARQRTACVPRALFLTLNQSKPYR